MDNSKNFQKELSFELGNVQGSINTFTGRLLFSTPDANINIESYNLRVNHVYNSHFSLPSRLSSKCGNKWKLDIEQYIYKIQDVYYYIDEVGMKHEFKLLTGTKYYDTSGLNFIFDSSTQTITTQNGVELKFVNERLTRINYKNFSKVISYNSKNQVVSYYDTREVQNRIEFAYYDDGLIKTCSIYGDHKNKYNLEYYYDENENLIYVKKTTHKGEKKIFKYEYNSAHNITKMISYNKCQENDFVYLGNKVVSLDSYNVKIIPIMAEVDEYLGSEFILGDDKYLSDKQFVFNEDDINKLDTIESLTITYFPTNHKTNVTNSNNVTIVYFYDSEGRFTTALEQVDESHFKDETNKFGLDVMPTGSSTICINNRNAYSLTSDTLSIKDTNENYFAEFKSNLLNNFLGVNYYDLSCLVYLNIELLSDKVKVLVINSDDEESVCGYGYLNKDAVNAWQKLNMSITINDLQFKNLKLKFSYDEELLPADNCPLLISDLKLKAGTHSDVILVNKTTNEEININDIDMISCSIQDNDNTYTINELIWSSTRLSFNDLLQLKKDYFENDSTYHIVSFDNGRYKRYATNIIIKLTDGITEINLNNYDLLLRNALQYDIEVVNTIYSFETEIINQENVKYMYIRKTGEKRIYSGDDVTLITNNSYEKFDLLGKIIEEKTSKNITICYEYDDYDHLINVYFTDQNSIEPYYTLSYNIYPSQFKITSINNVINLIYDNDCVLVKELISSKKGSEEDIITDYEYDIFNENIVEVRRTNGNSNFVKYSCSGKVVEFKTSSYADYDNTHNIIYQFDHTPLLLNNKYNRAQSTMIKTFNNQGNLFTNILNNRKQFKDEVDNETLTILEEENGNNIFTSTYNSKNKLISIKHNNEEVLSCLYDVDTESPDNLNNVISYNIVKDERLNIAEKYQMKNNDNLIQKQMYFPLLNPENNEYTSICDYSNKEYILTRETEIDKISYKQFAIGYNDVNYRFNNQNVENNFNKTDPENLLEFRQVRSNNVLESQIDKTTIKVLNKAGLIETEYYYDGYGRLTKKELENKYSNNTNKFNVTNSYNTETRRFEKVTINPFGSGVSVESSLSHDYNGKITGNLIRFTIDSQAYSYDNSYEYDTNEQLTKDTSYFGTKEFSYYADGTINNIVHTKNDGEFNNINYLYEKGLLTNIVSNDYSISLGYDSNTRDCVSITKTVNNNTEYQYLLNWNKNRLNSISDISKTINFEYNLINGLRYRKSVSYGNNNSNNYDIYYYYDDNKLLKEVRKNETLLYLYDKDGLLGFALVKDGVVNKTFYYIKNYDNSVIGIVDESYNLVGRYIYDAYGTQEIICNSQNVSNVYTNLQIMNLNPIRYKGYYYDQETNLFLVSLRYYSPELCRFIIPDDIEYLAPESINGLNLNCFNFNNPTKYNQRFTSKTIINSSVHPNLFSYALSKVIEVNSNSYLFSMKNTSKIKKPYYLVVKFSSGGQVVLFDYKENSHYNIINSLYFANKLNEIGLPEGRTYEGIWFELLMHYIAHRIDIFNLTDRDDVADMGTYELDDNAFIWDVFMYRIMSITDSVKRITGDWKNGLL